MQLECGNFGQGGAGGGEPCANDGADCFSNADCCSGLCGGGEFPTCAPSPCKSVGALCAQSSECCTPLSCQNGVCAF
jgi:hypothetical protein